MLVLNFTFLKKRYSELKHLAEIKFGWHTSPTDSKDAIYLQAKYFNEFGELVNMPDSFVSVDTQSRNFLLNDGDILLAGKGAKNFAWCYRKNNLGPAIASSIFFIIQPHLEIIYPEYLTIILNLPQSQLYFQQFGAGSSIQSIRKSELADFKIPLLSLENQKKIVDLADIHRTELKLLNNIVQKKKQLYTSILTQLTH